MFMNHPKTRYLLSALPACFCLGIPLAQAETVNCTPIVTPPPLAISVPGVYCLTGNITTSLATQRAINIISDNVVLDLNGYTLSNTFGVTTEANGVRVNKVKNVTVKNGTIRGFYTAIEIDDTLPSVSSGNLVEDIRADRNFFAGIIIEGTNNIARDNHIIATGGTTVTSPVPGLSALGIGVLGIANRVANNDIISVTTTTAFLTAGIGLAFGNDNLLAENRISDADNGITFLFGGTGEYRDNLTTNVVTPFSGGTNLFNNN